MDVGPSPTISLSDHLMINDINDRSTKLAFPHDRPNMHPRFAPYVFSFCLSGIMTFIVSGISTYRANGMAPDIISLWMSSWIVCWIVAYPVMLIAGPIVRRNVDRLVRPN